MYRFTLVALGGMAVTTMLSYQICYNLGLDTLLGPFLPSFAFGLATLIASLLTYSLNARYTFVSNGSIEPAAEYFDSKVEKTN
jgi:hypothetical protein